MALAAVLSLFFSGCPSAISRGISACVIDAFKRQVGWLFSHIGKKVLKFSPSGAYLDASAAVVLVVRMVQITASAYHALPRSVRWRAAPVFGVAVAKIFAASARNSVTLTQVNAAHDFLRSGLRQGCLCQVTVGPARVRPLRVVPQLRGPGL
jgi:hypothetical protein